MATRFYITMKIHGLSVKNNQKMPLLQTGRHIIYFVISSKACHIIYFYSSICSACAYVYRWTHTHTCFYTDRKTFIYQRGHFFKNCIGYSWKVGLKKKVSGMKIRSRVAQFWLHKKSRGSFYRRWCLMLYSRPIKLVFWSVRVQH